MNELSNREFIKRLEQKIPSKKVNFDNPVDVKEFFGDEDFLEYEEVFKDYIDLGYIFTRTYVRKGNKQGSPLYHNEISAFLRGGKSQSAKYNKKSGKTYKDIDEYLDFGRPIHVVPHMFRHSFVSILASEKVPLETIRSLVGHAEDSKEIERVYLHVLKKEKRYMKDVMMNLDEKLSD